MENDNINKNNNNNNNIIYIALISNPLSALLKKTINTLEKVNSTIELQKKKGTKCIFGGKGNTFSTPRWDSTKSMCSNVRFITEKPC